jgi:hypothetical protein
MAARSTSGRSSGPGASPGASTGGRSGRSTASCSRACCATWPRPPSGHALNTAARILERGELFGIYPEGTRSRSGKLHKGHTGVARLALRCDAPIVPVGVVGTREVQPPDTPVPKPFRTVTIRFGPPIDVSKYTDRADDRFVLRQITDEVMFEIRALTGLEYDPTYATKPGAAPTEGEVPAEQSTVERRSSADLLTSHAQAG